MEHSVLNHEMAALSKLLQKTMLNRHAFDMAVEEGFIVIQADGHLKWTLGSKTLLAYFCGRLWSGDRGKFSCRKQHMMWQHGSKAFPAVALNELFGIRTIKELRNVRKNSALPQCFEIIDNLFVRENGV